MCISHPLGSMTGNSYKKELMDRAVARRCILEIGKDTKRDITVLSRRGLFSLVREVVRVVSEK